MKNTHCNVSELICIVKMEMKNPEVEMFRFC